MYLCARFNIHIIELMKIRLIWVGKTDGDIFDEAIKSYSKKITSYFPYETIAVPYLKNAKNMSEEEQKKREGEIILKKIDNDDYVVLLDERGKELTSVQFSEFVQQRANSGLKTLTFVIGGAYGFSKDVYARQNAQIALSKLTFPHIMVRLVFAEQLYRACTILHNEPYHH